MDQKYHPWDFVGDILFYHILQINVNIYLDFNADSVCW